MSGEPLQDLLRGGCLRFGLRFGVFAAEALDAARSVDQLLLAGEKRVAVRADFRVDVAFVRGTGSEAVATGTNDANFVVVGVNSLFRHWFVQDLSVDSSILAVRPPGVKRPGHGRRTRWAALSNAAHPQHRGLMSVLGEITLACMFCSYQKTLNKARKSR